MHITFRRPVCLLVRILIYKYTSIATSVKYTFEVYYKSSLLKMECVSLYFVYKAYKIIPLHFGLWENIALSVL